MAKLNKNVYKARAVNDLGDYEDSERDFGPSMTDPSMDEPIEKLVARMMRGEHLGEASPVYDVPEGKDPAVALSEMSVTDSKDFDLADIAAITAKGNAALASVKKASKSKKPKEPEKPVVEAPKAPTEPEKA